jgi:L-seryl-tRNA(Ser) seleniumtransferase
VLVRLAVALLGFKTLRHDVLEAKIKRKERAIPHGIKIPCFLAQESMNNKNKLREIPSINALLQSEEGKRLIDEYSHEVVAEAFREGTLQLRLNQGELPKEKWEIQKELLDMARDILIEKFAPSLKRTINGTGTIIHTNLGRAKLSPAVKEALLEGAFSFSNLEYDVQEGGRGSRYQHLEEMLCDLTGAEAALVVNNNAAAVLLVLNTIAKGKEVIVSRGELVEIGGSFRIPEIIELSGCKLKEVGTTNKTHKFDYERAISDETAAILKVHNSNYKISGFTCDVSIKDISSLLRGCLGEKHTSKLVEKEQLNDLRKEEQSIKKNEDSISLKEDETCDMEIPIIHDMGSGMLIDLEKYGLPYEMTVMDSLKSGADIVTFSGDKVLGGPQGGIIVGKKKYIEAMKKNQLTRTLRVDKMTIATLEATLRLYYDEVEALVHIPTLKMLTITLEELEEKAKKLAGLLSGLQENLVIEVTDTYSQVGGGAYPGEEIKSKGLALSSHKISANQLSERLRKAPIPIIAKIRNERCELDVRTIEESEFDIIADALDDIFA